MCSERKAVEVSVQGLLPRGWRPAVRPFGAHLGGTALCLALLGSQGGEVGSPWFQVFLVHGVDSSPGSLQVTGGAPSLHQVVILPVVPLH